MKRNQKLQQEKLQMKLSKYIEIDLINPWIDLPP